MTTRRAFIGTLAGGLVAAPFAAETQQAAKVARIGYLVTNLAANPHWLEAFRQGLRYVVRGGRGLEPLTSYRQESRLAP